MKPSCRLQFRIQIQQLTHPSSQFGNITIQFHFHTLKSEVEQRKRDKSPLKKIKPKAERRELYRWPQWKAPLKEGEKRRIESKEFVLCCVCVWVSKSKWVWRCHVTCMRSTLFPFRNLQKNALSTTTILSFLFSLFLG